jgi:hypothetical protein
MPAIDSHKQSASITLQRDMHYTQSTITELYDAIYAANTESKQNVFLSQAWINATMQVSQSPPLYRFYANDELIGFCFIGVQRRWFGDLYYLNQTGNAAFDQMWIEHNDIIGKAEHLPAMRKALINYLCELPKFHRLVVSLSTTLWQGEKTFLWSSTCDKVCFVGLDKLREQEQHYAATLSKNTKSAINRATKYIEKTYGSISMQVHKHEIDEILTSKLAPLHIAQWGKTEQGSGFSNPHFMDFHQHFLQELSLFDQHHKSHGATMPYRCEVLSFVVENLNTQKEDTQVSQPHELGHLYMLLSNNDAFFYLSAINYNDNDNKYKPGLVMHKLAIEHYAAQGYDSYDFLAGSARYKESLSTSHYPMYTTHLAKNVWTHRLLYNTNVAVTKLSQILRNVFGTRA